MKLLRYRGKDGAVRAGVMHEEGKIHPLSVSGGDDALAYIASAGAMHAGTDAVGLDEVTLLAPLERPQRIFGIGLNYREHAVESKMAVQSVPTVFLKLASSITGPDSDVLLPPTATEPDYEAELAVVIGEGGYKIAASD